MDVTTTLPILLSWAVYLSGYPAPDELPQVAFVPHRFFVQRVCGGRECTVVGWYDDQDVVYLDEQVQHADGGGFADSLIVHELVHYLQHRSGRFDSLSCEDSRAREREAYRIQNTYILQAQSRISLIYPPPTACRYATAEEQAGSAAGDTAPLTSHSPSARRGETRSFPSQIGDTR